MTARATNSHRPQTSHLRLGTFVGGGPLLLLLLGAIRPSLPEEGLRWTSLGPAALLPLGAWLESTRPTPRFGRALGVLGVLWFWAQCAPVALGHPGLALGLALVGGLPLAWIYLEQLYRPGVPGGRGPRRWRVEEASLVQGACAVALFTWFLGVPVGLAQGTLGWAGAFAAPTLALALGTRWAWANRRGHARRWLRLGWATALGIAGAGILGREGPELASLPLFVATGVHGFAGWQRRNPPQNLETWWEPLFHEPARMLVATFLACGLIGGVVLALPASTHGAIDLLDASFTSFSAVCVTGLAVLDTPVDFTGFGQAMILLLIQIGGLGIMTFSTAALVLFGRRLSLRHERAVSELLSSEDRSDLRVAVRNMLLVTFVTELAGALALTPLFARCGDGWGTALWRATFTSVSAFCNAGFALQSESLVPYQDASAVLHVVAILIVVGGLGPVTVACLPRLIRGRPVPAQVKLIVLTNVVLLVLPTLFVLVVEWDHGLGQIASAGDRISNAWFQAVTLRTAGFNSVDLNALRPATITVMLLLMVIGGSPGSTAGGIKTTTAALAVLTTWAAIRGRTEVEVFGVRVRQSSVYKAAAVLTLAGLGIVGALAALQLTQTIPLGSLLFEVVSALGTVGLTLGATSELDPVGKILVIACMFAGRVGPLTLFMLLAQQGDRERLWRRPEQDVAIG